MNKYFLIAFLLFPVYIPIRLDRFGVNAFVSNTRPELITQTGKLEFVNFYISITVPL